MSLTQQSGRERKKREDLASTMLGTGRRSSAPSAAGLRKPANGSLASRIGVSKVNHASRIAARHSQLMISDSEIRLSLVTSLFRSAINHLPQTCPAVAPTQSHGIRLETRPQSSSSRKPCRFGRFIKSSPSGQLPRPHYRLLRFLVPRSGSGRACFRYCSELCARYNLRRH